MWRMWLVMLFVAAEAFAGVKMDELKGVYAENAAQEPMKGFLTELGTVYTKMYKKPLPVLTQPPAESDPAIVLGAAAVKAGLITKDELQKANPGGFVAKAVGNKLAAAGNDDWSAIYGVVFLLERLGVRYCSGPVLSYCAPDRAHHAMTPAAAPTDLEEFTALERPVLPYRNGMSKLLAEMSCQMADPKRGANPEIFKNTDQWIDHSAGYLVPKDIYYDKHPEYYAMTKEGKRVAKDGFSYHRTPLCLSNPDVTKISTETGS